MNIGAYNKAIVALVMALIGIVNLIWPGRIGLDETTVTAIVTGITPILVWLVPNKPPQPPTPPQ